ncbi:LLM class flavin-dependent oxidoreductase [Lentzea alba]|uniref:LLM class flavin-dependent oxidoreductase n=1 Tax=Lentzea alba TaxID=2714351 RepID=UPI0039BF83C3
MKLGLALPQLGAEANPKTIVEFAQRAEELGFDSLWVLERLLRPLEPEQGPQLPSYYGNVYSPLETLTYVAAHTSKIRLGTSIIDALFHVPVALGRQLATLDQFSGGRLIVGLGQGWSAEEFATSNVPMRRRGAGFEEFIEALRATWGTDPVSYEGRFYRIPKSEVGPKPVHPAGPEIIIAAMPGATASVERAGRLGLGFNPAGIDWASLEQQIATFHQASENPGRIVVRANGAVTADPIDEDGRGVLAGSPEQLKGDLAKLQDLGVDEVFWDFVQGGVPYRTGLALLDDLSRLRT